MEESKFVSLKPEDLLVKDLSVFKQTPMNTMPLIEMQAFKEELKRIEQGLMWGNVGKWQPSLPDQIPQNQGESFNNWLQQQLKSSRLDESRDMESNETRK